MLLASLHMPNKVYCLPITSLISPVATVADYRPDVAVLGHLRLAAKVFA